MSYLSHSGPLRSLWSAVHRPRPLFAQFQGSQKGQRGQSRSLNARRVPNPQVGPPQPVFGQESKRPKMAKYSKEPEIDPRTQGLKNQAMASGNHKRPPATFNKGVSPQDQGNPWPNLNGPKSVGTSSGAYVVLAIFSILSHLNFNGREWPSENPCPPGSILHHWPPWAILHPTNPQVNT
ncbi:hypothetical protein O181_049700 [Austropuccinia psidii MF-1]|uniref:Uncharacterized protein n=1 Tax=Austropuccinia psidii MF-1 TaxID=1389203 RepID=A0A9Q3DU16_9BASI|nr:hypothetical protein [Austropuccinia psidii MF-1]